jgi:capsular exopolysaccharide synthesis family protein
VIKSEGPKSGILRSIPKPEAVKSETAVAVLDPPRATPSPPPTPVPPARPPEPTFEPADELAPTSNLFIAVLRRWPWLVIGVAIGVVGGLLFHMQRPPVYQSGAQLLVIKNRPEMATAGASGDARVAYVEDYVATQVTLLRSQRILELAARKLDNQQLSSPPPASEAARVAFLTSRFAVSRAKEPGSSTPTNVLDLSFRSPNATDAPKYLRAIIEAYEDTLGTLYEQASDTRVKAIDTDLKTFTNDLSVIEQAIGTATRKLLKISREDLTGIRTRLTGNRAKRGELEFRQVEVKRDLELIEKSGKTRAERVATMDALGIKSDQTATAGSIGQTPEEVIVALELKRKELGQRLGPEHPEMIALDGQIEFVKQRIVQRDSVGWQNDELARHERKLKLDLEAVARQINRLDTEITEDERKVGEMGPIQAELEQLANTRQVRNDKIKALELERNQVLATRAGGYQVQAITPPTDGGQVAPILMQSLLLGAVLGLFLGGGFALFAEMSDRSFRTPAEIRQRLGVPVLGHIPRIPADAPPEKRSTGGLDPTLACFYRPTSREAEAYRGLRTQLYFNTQGRGHQIIQVTSPGPGDGKSTLAANLAISIAQSGKRVVLLDCDFRKPRVHKLFNLTNPDVGLASVMAGDARLEAAVRGCEVENLYLMPCGPRPGNPAELLTRPKFQEVLDELRDRYDFVVIDSPPVLAVSDPSAVAPRVDGVVVVFRMTKSARPTAERTREQLAAVGANVLGVVVNASSARSGGYDGYGYGYNYKYYAYHDDYTAEPEPAAAVPKKG